MTTKIEKISPKIYKVTDNDKHLGTISTYHNLFHNKYIYLKFNLSDYSVNIPFSKIVQAEHQALQVMIDSNENPIVDFLLRNGFICKRHCYTLTVNKKDLKIEINNKLSLHFFNTESPDYRTCCQLLYKYYKQVHQSVSPLTANIDTFIQEVPTKTGYYSTNELGEIDNLVFTENNEIAYICSWDRFSSNNFIETILVKMFQNYPSIFFEADDTDWMAYQLLSYFKINMNNSFNTYIFPN